MQGLKNDQIVAIVETTTSWPGVTAGTADATVNEESRAAQIMGSHVERRYPVGVAGFPRLLVRTERWFDTRVITMAAGIDGVLPSVVEGLVKYRSSRSWPAVGRAPGAADWLAC